MVDTSLIKLFARYNRETNEKMNGVIATLNDDEWESDLSGFYKSVRSLCSHLYIADYNWIKRFKNLRDFPSLENEYLSSIHRMGDHLFIEKKEYLAERPKLDAVIDSFIEEITEDDLSQNLIYKNYHGIEVNKNAGGLLLHMFNHQTHHRGMISVYLEILGKENDFYSLMGYL